LIHPTAGFIEFSLAMPNQDRLKRSPLRNLDKF
jgi:hypothetical protein